ncbi:MAG: HAMP domain-containing histidine kinase [Candidatus Omnitrophica bacterium]|nr:HAMP domain-containing histidine kinase [Candidatus Omnitrophota bacterium]
MTKTRNDYNVIISELGISPFHMMRSAFALIGIIPLLVLFYVIIGKNFLYDLFVGSNGFIVGFAIFISIVGFLYAYKVIDNMVNKLLSYSAERKRSDDEKTELILTVTHDLKTPLTVIKTGIGNMLDGIGGAVSKVHTGIGKLCLDAVDRINEFINEFLNISDRGFIRTNLRRELIDLNHIVKNEVSGISSLAKKNNQNLRYKTRISDSSLWADRPKISRAVMNLLSNAVKYTPPGGKINVALSGDEYTLKIAVMNTGPGILPDELGKIFTKYERLKEHYGVEGTGLGLSIVKDIVDLHKGHLGVKSEPGKETEFEIVLPKDLRTENRARR